MNKHIIKLNGHSGCQLDLFQNNQGYFVRKVSSNKIYNFRLKKQAIKQYKFVSKNVKTPAIYSSGLEYDLFYFDMEYVKGKTFAEYFATITISEIANYAKLLFANLYNHNNVKNPMAPKIFETKISGLEKILIQTDVIKRAFLTLKNYDWARIYKSPCHGDLTLENIIITPNQQIYLIDFLDSFYNSWLIDIAKLFQDLEIKWSFRNQEENATRNLRLLIAKEAILEEIRKKENGDDIIESIYHLLLLNIIRIYPYTKDKLTYNFLNNAVVNILQIIKHLKKR